MIYAVRHRSSYDYQEMVDLSYHVLHLTPRTLPHQRVIEASILTTPTARDHSRDIDYFGNSISFLSLANPHDHLVIEMMARVEVMPRSVPDPVATPPWETVRDVLAAPLTPEVIEATNSPPMQDHPLPRDDPFSMPRSTSRTAFIATSPTIPPPRR